MALKVGVSPFFGGVAWVDELTGIKFEKSLTGAMSTYDLSRVEASKLDGVRKAIRLNALILLEGELGEQVQAEPVKKEVKEEVKIETPVDEVVAEVIEPQVKEEVAKNPKRK